MAAKKPPRKGAAKAAPANKSDIGQTPPTVLHILADTTKNADRALLFRAVSERIRSCMLDHDEAALIAEWFDRLAQGQDPKRVFYGETRGRKKGATGSKFVSGAEVRLPDHIDLCWRMRQAMTQHDPDAVFAAVAKLYSVTVEYVRAIWEKVSPTLAPDPSAPGK